LLRVKRSADKQPGNFNATHVADNQTGPVSDVFGTNYWLGPQGSPQAYFVLDLGAVYNLQSVDPL